MVPCALDVCVATKVLDHSALADGLNLIFLLQIDKKIEALVLTPSTVWHNSVGKEQRDQIYPMPDTFSHTVWKEEGTIWSSNTYLNGSVNIAC